MDGFQADDGCRSPKSRDKMKVTRAVADGEVAEKGEH